MHRPEVTGYRAEGRPVDLHRSCDKRAEIQWAMRDAFAIFESGHLLYMLSLVSIDGQLDRIDEYSLIQMQKLLDPSYESTDLRNKLQFSFHDSIHRSLASQSQEPGASPLQEPASLAATRLQKLAGSAAEEPNGLRDVLKKHVFTKGCELRDFNWAELRSLVVAIEDDRFWEVFATKKQELQEDSRDPKEWQKEEVTVSDGYPPHLNPKCPRPQLYSLSGFLRGTLDFPLQDTSELEDALEPLCAREEDWAAFFNRQCLVEIGSSEWRSLRVVRTSLGTCPYLALAQCMVLYHELLLSDLEKEIDRLLYQSPNGDELEKTVHAKAMVDISTTLRRAGDSLWPPSIKVVEQNLQQRLTIVRDLLIFRPVNIFSYKMEHDLFNALIANNEIEGADSGDHQSTRPLRGHSSGHPPSAYHGGGKTTWLGGLSDNGIGTSHHLWSDRGVVCQ